MAILTKEQVYLDANVLIYAMETDSENGMFARRWLMQVERGRILAITSELTLAEVLPYPLAPGNDTLVSGYRRLLDGETPLKVTPIDRPILLKAAEIRAQLKSETPDAIHVSTALCRHCSGFVTNDDRLKLPVGVTRHSLADVMAFY